MNAQLETLLKSILISLGSSLVTRGYLDDMQLNIIVGAILALGGTGWAIYSRRKAGLIKSAAKLPEVTNITVTDQALADKAPKEVVGPKDTNYQGIKPNDPRL